MFLTNLDPNHYYFKANLLNLVEDSYFDKKGEFNDFVEELRSKEKVENQGPSAAAPVNLSLSVSIPSLTKMNIPISQENLQNGKISVTFFAP